MTSVADLGHAAPLAHQTACSFEHHHRRVPIEERAQSRRAICLHERRRASQQPRRLARMGREDSLRGELGEREKKRVGIEHRRPSALPHRRQQGQRPRVSAEPRPGDDDIGDGEQLRQPRRGRDGIARQRLDHEFGTGRHGSGRCRCAGHGDPARTDAQRRLTGQPSRARHAFATADDAHAPALPFVGIATTERDRRPHPRHIDPLPSGLFGRQRRDFKRRQRDTPGVLGTFAEQQPGLQGDECHGDIGAHCGAEHTP